MKFERAGTAARGNHTVCFEADRGAHSAGALLDRCAHVLRTLLCPSPSANLVGLREKGNAAAKSSKDGRGA